MAFHTREECADLTGESCSIPSHPRYSDPTTDVLKARNDEVASLRSLSVELANDRDRVRALLDIANRKLAERDADVPLERIKAQDEIIAGHQEATKRLRAQITTIAKQRDALDVENFANSNGLNEATSALATMTILWLKRGELEGRLVAATADHANLKAIAADLERRASQWDADSAAGRDQVKRLVDDNQQLREANATLRARVDAQDKLIVRIRTEQTFDARSIGLLRNIATAWATYWERFKERSQETHASSEACSLRVAISNAYDAANTAGIFNSDDIPF